MPASVIVAGDEIPLLARWSRSSIRSAKLAPALAPAAEVEYQADDPIGYEDGVGD
jgi:hypothetical protein